MLFVVGLAGFLARWITAKDVNDAGGVSGGLAEQINNALSQSGKGRWVAVFLGLIGIAWSGRSLSKALVTTSCLTWRMAISSKASVKVIGGIVGVVAGIALMSMIVNRIRGHLGIGVAGLSFIGVMAFYAVAWVGVSLMLPRVTSDPGALLPGAAIVALTIGGMQAVSQLYLPDKLSHASDLYGAMGTTIVTLGWFFILGRSIVFAMVMNAVIYERFGSISGLLLSLPVVRILPRKSAWIRKFFDVDSDGKSDKSSGTQASAASSDSTEGAK
jgi:membrane protein